jgi:gluconate 5-dehydrogenase
MHVKELFDLTGRVAIVTGGSIGLGRQMAEALSEAGAKLVLCARNKERCDLAAAELQRAGAEVLSLACDVKKPESIQAVVDQTVARFGRIDILINNAGTSWGAPVEEMKLDAWNKVMDTNGPDHGASEKRQDYQYRFSGGIAWFAAGFSSDRLPGKQGRPDRVHQRFGL